MSKRIGKGPCPNCGTEITYKVNQKEHLYAYCLHPADGGCGSGTTSRSDKGDELLARKVVKWDSAEDRKKWLPDSSEQPVEEPDESEMEEAEENEEITVAPAPAPQPRPVRRAPPDAQPPKWPAGPPAPARQQSQPATRPKRKAPPGAKPPARRSIVDDLL